MPLLTSDFHIWGGHFFHTVIEGRPTYLTPSHGIPVRDPLVMEFPDCMKSHFYHIWIPFRRWADRISNRAKAVDEITSNRLLEIDLRIFP